MKRLLFLAAAVLLTPVASLAQEERVQTSGEFTFGVQQVERDNNSAKFNEYRDIRNGFYLYSLELDALDTESGLFMEFLGENLIRDDQYLRFGLGSYGSWGLEVEQNKIPRNISNKAKTPYIYQGGGLFTVPTQVPIQDDGNNATGSPALVPTAAQMAGNDAQIAEYLATHLRSVELGTDRDKVSATLKLSPIEALKFRLTVSKEDRTGSRITYGPIGDRPPRTLNVQLPEPVDYTTKELRLEAEYAGDGYQTLLSYLLSDFENNIDSMVWENMFFAPNNGDYLLTALESDGTTRRRVSSFGQRALAPDNRYHNVALSFGVDLPMNSRLAATAAYGWMRQDETLLPYSISGLGANWNNVLDPVNGLPRLSADARIDTKLINLDYTVNPVDRLNLRAFFRYYDLDNKTATDQWRYVTQDVVGGGGTVNYRNHRNNLAYAYTKTNYGLETAYSVPFWRTTLGLGYEREEIDRDFREADTEENIFRASVRTRPADTVAVRLNYLFGDREGKGYNYRVTDQSYWYTFAQSPATGDRDNPAFAFANHPDLRKFDVSDRERHQVDASVTVTPVQTLDLTAAYGFRKDDFDSGVSPVQPLANFPDPARLDPTDLNRATLGIQLGLLEEKRQHYTLNAFYAPSDRWSFSAFGSREQIDTKLRGLVFNENRRENPSAIGAALTNLGRWDDERYLFDTRLEDRTNTVGVGAGYVIIPGRLNFAADYTLSRGRVEFNYSGYGTDIPPDPDTWETFQFGFRSPETTKHNQYVVNLSLEYQLLQGMILGLHYLFDRYSISDWMQEPGGPWVEQVGSEFFLRDSSQDNRWGNRLVNMGSYLGPSYEAHVGYLTLTYKF